MGKTKQVIVGNSAAALSAIRAIRGVDLFCPITLITAERCNAYSPVLLTYYLKGDLPREKLFIVDTGFYRTNNVETNFGIKAVGLDVSRQAVQLEDGREVEYDNLLIATGVSPMNLTSSGEELDNVFSLRTIEDAEKIRKCASNARKVIIVGAGLIGLQTSDALAQRKIELTIIEQAEQVLPMTVGADCAAIIQKEIESHGVSILRGRRVIKTSKRGRKAVVVLDSGEELAADMVIVGAGVRPNIQFLGSSGIEVNRGVLINELMQTNIRNIFAAGDVSEGKNLVTGEREVLPNWSNACKQGRIAGLNMAGYKQAYEGGLKETVTTIFGLTVASIGLSGAPNEDGVTELLFSDPNRKTYRKILLADNRIVGATLLGRAKDAGMLNNLIRNRKSILPWKEGLAKSPLDLRKQLLAVGSR